MAKCIISNRRMGICIPRATTTLLVTQTPQNLNHCVATCHRKYRGAAKHSVSSVELV